MKRYLWILAVIAIVIGAFWLVSKNKENASVEEEEVVQETLKEYSSPLYGLSFSYPSYYFLEEKEIDQTNRIHHQIILTEDTQENRDIREGTADRAREVPTSITIDIFQNNLDRLSAYDFVTGNNNSNYKLGDGRLSSTTKGTLVGIEYSWSGLYEGRSLAVSTQRYVYVFSVTRIEPDDRIVADFEGILQTALIK